MDVSEIDYFGKLQQYDLTIDGEEFDVYKFEAEESIFSCFKVEITIASLYKMTFDDYLGKEALFTMIGRRTDRYFHGFVSTLTWEEPRGRYYLYRVVLVPSFWKLNLISDIRIFQDKTTREIVKEVLKDSGILANMYEFRDHGKYSPREHCVQYRETNLEFISRLLAEEGMFYYFEFTKESHLLVIGDMDVCHKYITGEKEVPFSPPAHLVNQIEHVTEFQFSKSVTTGKVSFKDYHFNRPAYLPEAKRKDKNYDDLEFYDYPGYLTDKDTGFRLAKTALERAMQNKEVIKGKSICRRFTSGHIFILSDHEIEIFNDEYVFLEIKHKGKQPQVLRDVADDNSGNTYSNTFKCISGYTTFRPPKPQKPSVTGVQTAIVTGPPGEEIHVDEYGRIKVQFYWDRLGENNENSSCWMRVAQPWAGAGWGTVFIPRIGQEVVVSFIDGDPDKPFVTGALYNGANYPPYNLPAEKTKSTIKTRSTKDSKGFNELRFEDKSGEEEIFIHGEKDWNIEIKNDKSQHVGHDEILAVDHDRSKTVGNDQSESIGNNKDITVAKNHTESIGENMLVTIGKNLDESTGESKTVSVGKNIKETIGENSDLYVTNNERIEIGKNHTENIGSDNIVDIGKSSNTSITENSTLSVGKHFSANVTQSIHAEAGEKILIVSNNSDITLKTAGATLTITNSGDVNIKGANVNIDASGKINMNGKAINQN